MFRYFVETNDCRIIEVYAYRNSDGLGYETFDDYRKLPGVTNIERNVNTWLGAYKDTLQFQTSDQPNKLIAFNDVRYFWEEEWPD